MIQSGWASAAGARGLALRGQCALSPDDGFGQGQVVLLGPDEPAFWPRFQDSPEYADGAPNPLDRWSHRQVGALAQSWGGRAVLPYDGPPWPPFLAWAQRSGQAWASPVGLLVHATAGLFLSFRGAVLLPEVTAFDDPAPTLPCTSCADQPCATACPIGALAPGQDYDVPACQAHLRSPQGAACRAGCLVRRACPISQTFGRDDAQSAFHMRAFLGE